MPLITEPNFKEFDRPVFREFSPGDDFYEALIAAHEGLSEAQSHELNAKLVLFLSNHIGDLRVLRQAFQLARESVTLR
ncbi:MAG: DUF2783 domain-containing protein [Betaproteobacteria bacterium]|jgi:hypothetical protein|nr:DUF2783 domain-containing protein [Betaproteobacteria bacterium]